MSVEQRPRLALAVEPLDENSRRLVPRTVVLEERTAQRDEDLPSTEPDGFGHERLTADRDSVISALKLLEDQKQRTEKQERAPDAVDAVLPAERETEPSRAHSAPSDVFAPLGAKERVLDEDAATPRDRPVRHIEEDKATDLDARIAPTATLQPRPEEREGERTEPLPERPRHERETEAERALVKSVYDTERVFFALKDFDPVRASHIELLSTRLKESDAYGERDVVLAQHARERRALEQAPPEQQKEREDRVMATALVAHELDDRYREQMSAHRDRLIGELDTLTPEKLNAVLHDFESFRETDGSNDSAHCRRQMHEALKKEPELHRAYVYAIALDRRQQRGPDSRQLLLVNDADAERGDA